MMFQWETGNQEGHLYRAIRTWRELGGVERGKKQKVINHKLLIFSRLDRILNPSLVIRFPMLIYRLYINMCMGVVKVRKKRG